MSATVRIILGASLISTSAVWVRLAEVDPTAIGVYRMGLAALGLALLAAWKRWQIWAGWRYAVRLAAPGVFFALDLSMWHRSIHFVGPGLATVLANLQVFVLATVGVLFLGERPGWRLPAGLALALPGLVLLVGLDLDAVGPGYLTGVLLGLGCAVAYGGFLLTLRAAQGASDALRAGPTLMYSCLWTTAIMAIVTILNAESFAVPDASSMLALLAYALLCQVMGWYLLTDAMPRVDASLVGALLLLQPSLAMVWDVVFFERPLQIFDFVGGALVLLGLYLAYTGRRLRRPRP